MPLLDEAIHRLEGWKGFDARKVTCNDEEYAMIEVSLKAIQEVIDLLEKLKDES